VTGEVIVALQRVLHVEDDESIIAIARVALETLGGLTVLSCSNGNDALEQAPAFDPELLLLDVMMPGMDGPTTLVALADVIDLDRIPVVFMTAKTQPADHASYYALGAAAVIVKPFDPLKLGEQLKEIWDKFDADALD
jgi:CheY-like chemotaxis protein